MQQKESNFQNKVYTLPHAPASAFISAHVHNHRSLQNNKKSKGKLVKIKFYNIINTRRKSKPY